MIANIWEVVTVKMLILFTMSLQYCDIGHGVGESLARTYVNPTSSAVSRLQFRQEIWSDGATNEAWVAIGESRWLPADAPRVQDVTRQRGRIR